MLAAGSGNISALEKQADMLNVTIGQFDADKVAQVGDEMERLKASTGALAKEFTVQVAPALRDSLILLTAAATEANKGMQGLSEIEALDVVEFSTKSIGAHLWDWTRGSYAVGKGMNETVQELVKVELHAQSAMDTFEGIADQSERIADLYDKLAKDVRLFGMDGNERAIADLSGASPEQVAELTAMADQLKAMEESVKRRADLETLATKAIEDSLTPQDHFNNRAAELNDLLGSRLIDFNIYMDGLMKANDALVEATKVEPKKDIVAERAADRMKDLETPLQKYKAELAEINEEAALGVLDFDNALLARLTAEREFLESLPEPEQDTGPQRPAALLRGTAAAFSASFGADPKNVNERLIRVIQDQTRVIQHLNDKIGPPVDR